MTYERWLDLKAKVKGQFKILAEGKGPLSQGPGELEYLEFDGPSGRTKLELVRRPVVLDKKTHYSKRIGQSTAVEYVYDDKEQTITLHVYVWQGAKDSWEEVKASSFVG